MSSRSVRRLGFVVLALTAISAWQSTAHGLSVELWETEHDWTVQVGEYRFGLEQSVINESDRATDIHWGGGYTTTAWLASTIVIVGAGALATVGAVGGLTFAAFARRNAARSSSSNS